MRDKGIFLLVFFIVLTTFVSSHIQADVISINSGGTGNVILNPGKYIEDFFFGHQNVTAEEEAETPSTGGGGGGTPSTTPTIITNIDVEPDEFNLNMVINTTHERRVEVKNLGNTSVTVQVTQENLGNHVILGNQNLTIEPGQTANLNVIFLALSKPGIYTGKIFVGGHEVSVALNVKSELLLFDSNIVVLNPNFQVEQGEKLKTLVTLIPMGDPERLDVTLDYIIKDYSNNIYLTKSETLLVEEQISIRKDFETGMLPIGRYIVGLELKYPNGVAPSSAHFEVLEKIPLSIVEKIILVLVILILITLILIVLILILRRLRERKEETGSYFS